MLTIPEKIILEAASDKTLTDTSFDIIRRAHASGRTEGLASNVALFAAYQKLLKAKKMAPHAALARIIIKRKIRTLSGIAAITVMTPNGSCPGTCVFCPTERGMPKSYLSNEPAVMRAIANHFDPYLQVTSRLASLSAQGHATDKIEIIVIGGTWSSIPHKFQEHYIARLYEALNEKGSVRKKTGAPLTTLQEYNRKHAIHKLVGLTLETRPDWVTEEEVKRMRMYGCTRVELGVQSVYDDVLDISKRGHHIDAVARATALLKNAGFKINYHMMPNLPGSTPARDTAMFKTLFTDQRFQPDMLKIYPCMVVKNTELYRMWKKGAYHPYTDRQLISIITKAKSYVPEYCRIVRIIRDIPAPSIEAGSTVSNLRQVIHAKMKKDGVVCRCIRCREIKGDTALSSNVKLTRIDYAASGGKEIFLSFDDIKNNKLIALLRLRIPPQDAHMLFPALAGAALIREIHTYGEVVPLLKGKIASKGKQHKGLGKKLLAEAERIAKKEFKMKKMAVIAGAGVRGYYDKLGYTLKNTYMVKEL
ncbi:MAG: tRNA uridine(34) 5-carboxymethylaminomethyl modification radical SAM/GNAT enzyme Elp3 [Candidatus Azambacteria bacterium]|nr:tRNA uridine(34) 5-carboxymethylaminomethyl modification radical SAM/GNAT enzyme Elp3 [Candidatus Azambacteria bacterium]